MNRPLPPLPHSLRSAADQVARRLDRADLSVAVTLVEGYFRPPWRRAFEYVWWWMLHSLRIPRWKSVTIGVCQARADRFLESMNRRGREPTFRQVVWYGERVLTASEVAADSLMACDARGPVSRRYTGRCNRYYDELVEAVQTRLRSTVVGGSSLLNAASVARGSRVSEER